MMLCAFDFDGTLVDTRRPYYQAVEDYVAAFGVPLPSNAEKDAVFGDPSPQLIFPEWAQTQEDFVKCLHDVYARADEIVLSDPALIETFEGVGLFLEVLASHGVMLTLVTSRYEKPVRAIMAHHGMGSFFRTVRTGDDPALRGYRGKPHPDKLLCVLNELRISYDQAIMIGDTHMDMQMGKNAGVAAFGVTWGFHPRSVLKNAGATNIYDTVSLLQQGILDYFKVSNSI